MNVYRRCTIQLGMILMTGAVLFLILGGCSTFTRPPDVYQVELHRSEVQTLRLTNTHEADLMVLSKDGKARRTVAPGETMDIDFVVVTLKDIHLDRTHPWYVMQDTAINYVDQPAEALRFLETSGRDVVLNLQPVDLQPEPLRLSLHNCPNGWEMMPAATGMHMVGSRSIAGVPARICPR